MATDLNSPEVQARIIEERWRMAVMDGHPYRSADDSGETIDPYMTKRWHRITEDFQDIAGIVAPDGVHSYEFGDGPDSLDALVHRVWDFAHDEIVAWASEERRLARWQAWRDRESKVAS